MSGDADASAGVDFDSMGEYLAETPATFAVVFGSHAKSKAGIDSDVDIALKFPEEMDARDRFRLRNRIDAERQSFADRFVDVSDLDSLPVHVAYAAVTDGVLLAGDESAFDRIENEIQTEYESNASDREREQREFIRRIAEGET